MSKKKSGLFVSLVLLAGLSGCSSTQQLPMMGSQEKPIEEDSTLIVPPSLRMPDDDKAETSARTTSTNTRARKPSVSSKPATLSTASEVHDRKNYYVVVGTYPNHQEALDTFIRLSSIGLPNSTMETRTTKSGQQLHMVRLGPFQDQNKIDKVKDSLLSDGLSQFKVVEN